MIELIPIQAGVSYFVTSRKLFIDLRAHFESLYFRQVLPLLWMMGVYIQGIYPGQEPLKGHEEAIPEEDDKDIN